MSGILQLELISTCKWMLQIMTLNEMEINVLIG